jgi:hypothetical protein
LRRRRRESSQMFTVTKGVAGRLGGRETRR